MAAFAAVKELSKLEPTSQQFRIRPIGLSIFGCGQLEATSLTFRPGHGSRRVENWCKWCKMAALSFRFTVVILELTSRPER